MSIKDLVEGIKDARAAGLKDVEAKLQKRLDQLLGEPPEPLSSPHDAGRSPPNATHSTWIEGQGLEEIQVEPSELPRRTRREKRLLDAYFNEGAHRYAEDEERFQEMASCEMLPERFDPEID